MLLGLEELEYIKDSEILHQKIDEILIFIKEKGVKVNVSPNLYYDKGTLTLSLALSFSLQNQRSAL